MKVVLTLAAVMILLPSFALAQETRTTQQCTCTYLPAAATESVYQKFTDAEWLERGVTADAELCQKYCAGYAAENGGTFQSAAYEKIETEVFKGVVPELGVAIPGFAEFQNPLVENGVLKINFIGAYVNAIYRWLIGVMALFAVVMIMVGGIQYMLRGGSQQGVTEAKARITNALVGMVILLGSYTLLYTTNPQLTIFAPISIEKVDNIETTLASLEGPGIAVSTPASAQSCKGAEDAARSRTCPMSVTYTSPVRGSYSCNYHFRENTPNYDSSNMRALDYPAAWNSEIRAPQAGTVVFKKGNVSTRCGNRIDVMFGGAVFSMCHAKDFVGESGRIVKQGEVIGHVGGKCCAGEVKPSGGAWSTANISGTCTYSGTSCTNPFSQESCDCQTIEQSGNTTGPHVHTTIKFGGEILDPLVCLR